MGGLGDRLMQCVAGTPRAVALSVQLQTDCWLVSRCSLLRQAGSSAPASSLHCAARAAPEPAQLLLCDRPRRSNLPRGRSTEYLYVASGRSATPGRPATRPTQTTPGSAGPRGRSGLPGVGRPPGRSRLPRGHAQNARLTEADYPGVGQPHSQLPAPGYSGQPHFPLALCRFDREN